MTILVLSILLTGSVLFNIRNWFHKKIFEDFIEFLANRFFPDLTDEEIDKVIILWEKECKAKWYKRFGIKK